MPLTEEEKKERKLIAQKKYALKNKDKISAYKANYRATHKEEMIDYQRNWRASNPEKCREHNEASRGRKKEYQRCHKAEAKVRSKKYYEANKTKVNDRTNEWRVLNRVKYLASMKRVRDELRDSYIISNLSSGSTLSVSTIPQSLIKVKRAYIKGMRLIKEQEDER